MKEICKDLAAEGQALDDIVADISDDDWDRETPFGGWTVKDEIAHVAYFDWFAMLSATDKEAFQVEMTRLANDLENLFQITMEPGRSKTNAELLAWWRTERKAMIAAYLACDPKDRLPWHLPMSARSSATARLMETWAHGQDVVDALGARRPATDRLKHIAHLGVATFGWSFQCRGMEKPEDAVRVSLKGPSGDLWTWGPEDAANQIQGDAEDFCLVVAQRRHFLDTRLEIAGETAEKWMTVAQIFAGPPARGPAPGKFPK
jgi:uncharacterized protein (TIGR03084 family)